MSRKRKRPAGRPGGRAPRMTSRRVVEGWKTRAGVRVRLARAGEGAAVGRYMDMAGAFLMPGTVAAVEAGDASLAVREALDRGIRPLLAELAGLSRGDDDPHMAALTTVLVAEGAEGELVGAFTAMPPFAVMAQGMEAGIAPELMLAAGAAVARFSGLAVDDEARGLGIGSELLRGALGIYAQLDYKLYYGQIEQGTGLERYYPRFGFEVLAPGEGPRLADLGIPMGIAIPQGQRAITRWA